MKETPNWLTAKPWLKYTQSNNLSMIENAIYNEQPDERDLALMLSPYAQKFIEPMAQRAKSITQRHFGKTISLYSPLYLSNFCNGGCLYCGIAADRRAIRSVLDMQQLEEELLAIKEAGLDEIVLLTGERMPEADVSYIRDAIKICSKKISSINIEVFPMLESEYRLLAEAGCTSVTLYQETYNQEVYQIMHRWGDKRDFFNRLHSPDRALNGGLRSVGLGVLLGLAEPTEDLLCVYRHANYLLKNFWQSGVTISFPRIKPQMGEFKAQYSINDSMFAQYIFALRICLPAVPLLLSTRESIHLRDGLAGIGISKMSVASKTTVGGYSEKASPSTEQFSITDERSVGDFCKMLREKKLEPVFKNNDALYREPVVYHTSEKAYK